MSKIFINILGIILISIGLTFNILYLNLLTLGYNFIGYFIYIISNFYCLLLPLGILILIFNKKILNKNKIIW